MAPLHITYAVNEGLMDEFTAQLDSCCAQSDNTCFYQFYRRHHLVIR